MMTICVGTVGGGVHVSPEGVGAGPRCSSRCRRRATSGPCGSTPTIRPASGPAATRACSAATTRVSAGSTCPPRSTAATWSVAVDPTDSDTVYLGTRPGSCAADAGASWDELPVSVVEECLAGVPAPPTSSSTPAARPPCGPAWRSTACSATTTAATAGRRRPTSARPACRATSTAWPCGPATGRPRRRRADLRHHAVRRLHQRRRGRHLGPPPVPRLLRGQQAGLLPLRDVQGRRHRHDVRGHRRHDPARSGRCRSAGTAASRRRPSYPTRRTRSCTGWRPTPSGPTQWLRSASTASCT